jgi:hypothetical protein
MFSKEQIKYIKLLECRTLEDCNRVLDIYSECLLTFVDKNHYTDAFTLMEKEAKIIVQMILTKVLHLKNSIKPLYYKNKADKIIDNIIDPTVIAVLIRNIYEMVGVYNLIFRKTQEKESRELIYNLWTLAGLKYRQKFTLVANTTETIDKAKSEYDYTIQLESEIINSQIFKGLSEKDQGKIRTKIKDKDFLIEIKNNEVHFLSLTSLIWHNGH